MGSALVAKLHFERDQGFLGRICCGTSDEGEVGFSCWNLEDGGKYFGAACGEIFVDEAFFAFWDEFFRLDHFIEDSVVRISNGGCEDRAAVLFRGIFNLVSQMQVLAGSFPMSPGQHFPERIRF